MFVINPNPLNVILLLNGAFRVSLLFAALFGFVLGFAGMIIHDGPLMKQSGMFQGYSTITCIVVVLQVFK